MKVARELLLRCMASIAVLVFALPAASEACAVCFGAVDSPMTEGMNNGILSMLGVLGAVQVGFVALFLRLRKRFRRFEKARETISTD
jgi:hypothetical protein